VAEATRQRAGVVFVVVVANPPHPGNSRLSLPLQISDELRSSLSADLRAVWEATGSSHAAAAMGGEDEGAPGGSGGAATGGEGGTSFETTKFFEVPFTQVRDAIWCAA
jgi:hypothetical protein